MTQLDLLCLLDGIYYIPCILVPVCLYALRHKSAGLRLGPVSFKQMLQCLAAAYLCVMLANSLAALWSVILETIGFRLYSTEIVMNNGNDLIKAIFSVAVLPGICEELLFRGVVLSAYERGGTRKAIFISALLFSTLHGTVQGFPVQLLIGIILGFAVCSTGSIYISMMIHTAYNAFLLLISYLYRGIDVPEYSSIYESLGGAIGLATVLIECVVSGGILWLILSSFARQGGEMGITHEPEKRLRPDTTAVIALISGIVTVCYMYGQDIMLLLGY
ncbi:MAG: CPBP family intramembrane metalloprotease [Clostridia bacterium]|nr:CPBP family intramembrane metalloprotease [Clostridia bacterium]